MAVWRLEDGTAKVSEYTTIKNGLLYVGLGQSAGTIIVKGGEEDDVLGTATVTCVLENVVPNPINVLADNSENGTRQLTIKAGDRTITGGTWSLEKTHTTVIDDTTTINNNGLLTWSKNQSSGQIAAVFTKDGVTKSVPIVFKKSEISITPATANVKNGATQQFTLN